MQRQGANQTVPNETKKNIHDLCRIRSPSCSASRDRSLSVSEVGANSRHRSQSEEREQHAWSTTETHCYTATTSLLLFCSCCCGYEITSSTTALKISRFQVFIYYYYCYYYCYYRSCYSLCEKKLCHLPFINMPMFLLITQKNLHIILHYCYYC